MVVTARRPLVIVSGVTRTIARGVAVVLALVLAACSSRDPATPSQPRGGLDDVSLSFIQLRVDEGSDFAQLRVVNESESRLAVRGVGLDWPGYGEFLTDYDTVVEAGRVLDLRFELPGPVCDGAATGAPVVGQLRTDDGLLRDELDESGAGYVTRIHTRTCDDQRVEQAARLTYDGWRLVGSGRRARLEGLARLEAVSPESGSVSLGSIGGTVLLRLTLRRPLRVSGAAASDAAPVTVDVPRCDEHALTESSQTFHFKPTFRFGDEGEVTVLRIPDATTRQAGQRLLREACVRDGSAE